MTSPIAIAALVSTALSAAPASLPPVREKILANGMRVLVLERHESPTVSFNVAFKVGAVEDPNGATGQAHMFEHMIFKGTERLNTKDYASEKYLLERIEASARSLILEQAKPRPDPEREKKLQADLESLQKEAEQYQVPDEYERLYMRNGGTGMNAYTAPDLTDYFVSLPSNKVSFWAAMEADRFQHPVLREFYRERNVVMEERRMHYESSPEGMIWQEFQSVAFHAHPYRNEGIGWMSDLRKLNMTDTRAFFDKYYSPNNAVVSVVGDVKAEDIFSLLEEKLGRIPARPVPPDFLTLEPEQRGERRSTIHFDAQPEMLIGYKRGDISDPDEPAYEMIQGVLSDGRTSRFYKHLVEGKKLARSVEAYSGEPGIRYPCLFVIDAAPLHPATPEQLEKAIYEELESLAKDGPTERELQKVRNNYQASLVMGMASNQGMAERLSYNQAIAGDWRYPWGMVDRLDKVTAQDVKRVARVLFDPDRRTVVVLRPPDQKPVKEAKR